MPNIKFSYLYRDGGNYKKYSYVIFSNNDQADLLEIEKLIRLKLIWSDWFYADEWILPELFLDTFHFRVDPTCHEFEAVEFTNDPAGAGGARGGGGGAGRGAGGPGGRAARV